MSLLRLLRHALAQRRARRSFSPAHGSGRRRALRPALPPNYCRCRNSITDACTCCLAVYTAANISGGHLNPAVTFSTLACGFYPVIHSVLYMILQVRLMSCIWHALQRICLLHTLVQYTNHSGVHMHIISPRAAWRSAVAALHHVGQHL